ncbi:MAG: outer membrane protein assembly factor BamA [Gammaproteobacteria bacterium]|nr:outer membrane protein assembly factor BamA [Gammaproteobacteria bacterium]
MKKILAIVSFSLCLISPSNAIESFVVTDIRVEGLQRISSGTVFNYLPIKVGDEIDEQSAQDAIRVLFKTGFFTDVQLKQEGTVLVVAVEERPSIAKIEFIGNKEIKEDALKDAMKQIGFTEGRVFNRSVLDKVTQELKNQYFSLGKYGAEVDSNVTILERNRVAVELRITEGETAKIKQVNIVGNESFEEKALKKKFQLSTKGVFDFLSSKDRYSKQKLSADLETLRSFYQDQGYLDFNINSTQVSITPDKKDIYITINITEGEKYTVSDFAIKGKLVVPESELLELVVIQPGSVYSRKEISASRKAITDRLADEGYAFANVNAVPEIDKENKEVSFDFFVDPGRRVYVRRIDISGNTTTQDEVIRRELRQLEGSWFSAQKVQRSRVRLQRLGFFDDVNIETPPVPGSPDQVDIQVVVTERSTGSLLFGVGFSDADGILLQASVSQRNLFGSGRELDLSFDNSSVTRVINLQYTNPYHTLDGVSRGFSIFRRRVDASEADTAEYITETTGGGLNYRFPLSEFNSLNTGGSFERIDLTNTSETPPEIREFIDENPESDIFKFTGSLAHDTRDSFLYPTRGLLQRLSLELAVPGSDLEYYKASYNTAWYTPITTNLVFKASGELGYGDGYSGTEDLPFFKNFFAGGASTVRGYEARSLGPKDTGSTPEPIGGSKRILVNSELLFPLPGSENRDKRLSLFIDGGQVYGPGDSVDVSDLRFSAGVGFGWFSPLGPLAISFAIPINDKDGDDTEQVQFTLGRFFR